MFWRPATGSSVSRTPLASQSIWGYQFRLLGDGLKLKSVTPYCSQSERGTQPCGGGNFPPAPGGGGGGEGIEREESVWGPLGVGRESIKIFLFRSRGEGGGLQPGRAGDGGLVSSLTQRDSSGQGEGGGGDLGVYIVAGWGGFF